MRDVWGDVRVCAAYGRAIPEMVGNNGVDRLSQGEPAELQELDMEYDRASPLPASGERGIGRGHLVGDPPPGLGRAGRSLARFSASMSLRDLKAGALARSSFLRSA